VLTVSPVGHQLLVVVACVALYSLSLTRHPAEWAATIVAVLILHECGHLLGMWLFGFWDPRVLFIPFVGTASNGPGEAAPGWQAAVVLLLGPLPGIAVGFALASSDLAATTPEVYDLVVALVWANALSLLPIGPLDGGRLCQTLLLVRRPGLTGWVRAVTISDLGFWAWSTGAWPLWVVAGVVLIFTPVATQTAAAARVFRAAHPSLPRRADELTNNELGEVVALWRMSGQTKARPLWAVAEWVRDVHDQAVRDRAGCLAVLVLLTVYAGTGVVAGVATTRLKDAAAAQARGAAPVPQAESN
jgi:Zn-dependent protease